MIRLSNGHILEYLAASGALGYDGRGWLWERPLIFLGIMNPRLFTVVTKTLTILPRAGNLHWPRPWTWLPNPWSCVRFLPRGGVVNKVGLTNPGFDWWCRTIGPKVKRSEIPLIVSIQGAHEELRQMAERLNAFELAAVEVNTSCPNAGEELRNVGEAVGAVTITDFFCDHPVIAKLSVGQDYLRIAEELAGVAEAISLNSVPWERLYPHRSSPLRHLQKRVGGSGGGVSGRPAQALNWEAVYELANRVNIPVIAPSIMEFADLARVEHWGASAASFGAIHLRTPWKPTAIVRRDLSHRENRFSMSVVPVFNKFR